MRIRVAVAALQRRISMLPDGVYIGAGLAVAGLFVKCGIVEAATISKEALSEVPGNVKKQYAGIDIRFRPASLTGVHLPPAVARPPPPPPRGSLVGAARPTFECPHQRTLVYGTAQRRSATAGGLRRHPALSGTHWPRTLCVWCFVMLCASPIDISTRNA